MTGQAGERGEVEALTSLLAEHRRNGPIGEPGDLNAKFWRVKCDGHDCDFYREATTYWKAAEAHDEHLAAEVAAHVRAAQERAVAEERERLAVDFAHRATVYEAHPEHDTDRYLDGYSSGMRVAEKVARASRPEPERGEGA